MATLRRADRLRTQAILAVNTQEDEQRLRLEKERSHYEYGWAEMQSVVDFFEEIYPHEIDEMLRRGLQKPFPRRQKDGSVNLLHKCNRSIKSKLGMINYIAQLVPHFPEWEAKAKTHFGY